MDILSHQPKRQKVSEEDGTETATTFPIKTEPSVEIKEEPLEVISDHHSNSSGTSDNFYHQLIADILCQSPAKRMPVFEMIKWFEFKEVRLAADSSWKKRLRQTLESTPCFEKDSSTGTWAVSQSPCDSCLFLKQATELKSEIAKLKNQKVAKTEVDRVSTRDVNGLTSDLQAEILPVEQSADPLDVGKVRQSVEIKAKSELVMKKAYNDMNERLKKDWGQLEKYHKAVVSALSEAKDQKMTLPELQNCLFKNGDGALAEKTQLVSHLSMLNCLTVRGEFWTFVQGQVCSGAKCINWLPKAGTPTKIDLQRHKRFQTPISTSSEVTPPEYLLSSPKPSFHDVIREAIRASVGGTISRPQLDKWFTAVPYFAIKESQGEKFRRTLDMYLSLYKCFKSDSAGSWSIDPRGACDKCLESSGKSKFLTL